MKRRIWLFAAAALLALAAWLMSRGDGKAKPARDARVQFPHHAKQEEHARNERRRTLAPKPDPSANADYRPRRDPLLTALPGAKGKSAMVFEASVLKDSPVGKLWLDCMLSKHELSRMEKLKDTYGVDLLGDIDRVAISSQKMAVVSGQFDEARFDTPDRSHRAYGVQGMIYEDKEGAGRPIALWNKSLVMLASNAADIESAIDRLEDRGPPSTPPIPDRAAYGDVYGVISAEDLASLLPPSEAALANQLRQALEHIELHVDASEDVAIVADVTGPSTDDVDDLGKTLGSALALGRVKAQAEGDDRLAELLELARVSPHEGRFSLDLALPLPLIQRQVGPCPREKEGTLQDGTAAPSR